MARFSDVIARIAVPFFGGFLGAVGVALVNYSLGVVGVSRLFGVAPLVITQQWLQNFSWGGEIWGLIPAAFLIIRKGNIYLVSLLTMIVAVSYGQFILAQHPLMLSSKLVYAFLVNLIYVMILSLIIRMAGFGK